MKEIESYTCLNKRIELHSHKINGIPAKNRKDVANMDQTPPILVGLYQLNLPSLDTKR